MKNTNAKTTRPAPRATHLECANAAAALRSRLERSRGSDAATFEELIADDLRATRAPAAELAAHAERIASAIGA